MHRIKVVTGHYGSGKTTLSLNLAVMLRNEGRSVTVADMDIVNPFFRTADSEELFKQIGIRMILPEYANSNLESVMLTGEFQSVFNSEDEVILDVGGDDDGAVVLGRYRQYFEKTGYDMIYTASCYRPMTRTPAEAAALLKDIESASGLKASCLANTSSLGGETGVSDVINSAGYIKELERLTGLRCLFTAVREDLAAELTDDDSQALGRILPIKIYTKQIF